MDEEGYGVDRGIKVNKRCSDAQSISCRIVADLLLRSGSEMSLDKSLSIAFSNSNSAKNFFSGAYSW